MIDIEYNQDLRKIVVITSSPKYMHLADARTQLRALQLAVEEAEFDLQARKSAGLNSAAKADSA